MKINREQVAHIAHLARLEFSDQELDAFTGQMNDILAHFDKLLEVDTSSVEPTSHAITVHNVFREDRVHACLAQSQALANAPDSASGLFRVPKIIE
ncbi:MAG TPA: Asp-tRNA(Asn)/Glu-tRNA(Gln) amidotransferase subunit GatC [Thermodesulfobacteriota bacterium]|nr:Asp-tRNA(Asn)/Glu-tRNA(Gln) amidotransferase subunit GatC [Deltaproteobacteria bacterium]HNR12838.1 Asp-tRNA(Asn)/Glu-tRNA(Gln) amidotransferase subunit GatC [Thermodesulfobacteriota bacterium]HNU72299.1 Asp-tRNA(Asn)/Glu-tRNA(Gln) amidotransferase subunit GatC [Thermodesulfobacteriota bacterium]HQO77750.1 Asp-tRNA(Asn)/Glu-tRNA(Gln) amidotransferase subunit GatC [Thermodesulfobacteriota bacterium]